MSISDEQLIAAVSNMPEHDSTYDGWMRFVEDARKELTIEQRIVAALHAQVTNPGGVWIIVDVLYEIGADHPQAQAILERFLTSFTQDNACTLFQYAIAPKRPNHRDTLHPINKAWFHNKLCERVAELGWVFGRISVKSDRQGCQGGLQHQVVIRRPGKPSLIWSHDHGNWDIREGQSVLVPCEPRESIDTGRAVICSVSLAEWVLDKPSYEDRSTKDLAHFHIVYEDDDGRQKRRTWFRVGVFDDGAMVRMCWSKPVSAGVCPKVIEANLEANPYECERYPLDVIYPVLYGYAFAACRGDKEEERRLIETFFRITDERLTFLDGATIRIVKIDPRTKRATVEGGALNGFSTTF
ncbi:hypothetical protein HY624_02015 [Candidatus Uhrbacteria bacterium]|nr:hypothetical protein [Candidatus Uhrbacteria bacterium]